MLVMLPMALPGLVSTVLLCLIFTWNEFFVAFNLTITKVPPLTVYIVGFKTSEGLFWAKMSAAATVSALPVIIARLGGAEADGARIDGRSNQVAGEPWPNGWSAPADPRGGRVVHCTVMKLLFTYLRPFRGMIVLAIVLAIINQVFSLLDPQIFRIIVDKYVTHIGSIPRADFIRGVGLLVLGFVGVAMVSRLAKNFQDYFINVASQSVGARMYADGVAHSMRLPYRAFEDQQSGAVLQQLQKARTDSRDMIGQAINSIFVSALTFLLVLGYSFFVHWSIAVALIIMAPFLGGLLSVLGRRIKAVQTRIFGETNALSGSTTESLRNIELIKSLGLETQEIERLNSANQKILDLELAKVKTVRMLMFSQGTALNFSRAVLILLMLVLISMKLITLGEFFSLMMYSFFVFGPLGEIGAVIAKYQETRASLENLQKIMAQEPAPRNPDGVVPDGIESLEFSRVTYRHPGARSRPLQTCLSRRAQEKASPLSALRGRARARSSSSSWGCTSRMRGGSSSTGSTPER